MRPPPVLDAPRPSPSRDRWNGHGTQPAAVQGPLATSGRRETQTGRDERHPEAEGQLRQAKRDVGLLERRLQGGRLDPESVVRILDRCPGPFVRRRKRSVSGRPTVRIEVRLDLRVRPVSCGVKRIAPDELGCCPHFRRGRHRRGMTSVCQRQLDPFACERFSGFAPSPETRSDEDDTRETHRSTGGGQHERSAVVRVRGHPSRRQATVLPEAHPRKH